MEATHLGLARCLSSPFPFSPRSAIATTPSLPPPSPPPSPRTPSSIAFAHRDIVPPFPVFPYGIPLLFGLSSSSLWAALSHPSPAFAGEEEIVENAQAGVGAGADAVTDSLGDGAISFLANASFLGLLVLTIGVVYLAVSDFREKRAREEEAKLVAAESSSKKKKPRSITAARGGPKGFGKRIQDED